MPTSSSSYDPNQLSALSYANGYTIWHYRDQESSWEGLLKPGFFDEARAMLRVADTVHIEARDFFVLAVVVENRAEVVLEPLSRARLNRS